MVRVKAKRPAASSSICWAGEMSPMYRGLRAEGWVLVVMRGVRLVVLVLLL